MLNDLATGNDKPVNLNSSITISSVLFVAVIGPEVFIVQPGFVLGMVQYMGFSEKVAGDIASVEIWGIALTTVVMTFFAQRFNWRYVFFYSLIIMILGNIASLFVDTPLLFGITRFIVGFGAGGIISLSFTVVGLTEKPDRIGITVIPTGWIQEEDALKLALREADNPKSKDVSVAREAGISRYERIVNLDFSAAKEYWERTSAYWEVVREQWGKALAEKRSFSVKTESEGQFLFLALFKAAEGPSGVTKTSIKQEVKEILEQYID